ncbi:hypothetical protein D3C85_1774030 [compost metagenome]
MAIVISYGSFVALSVLALEAGVELDALPPSFLVDEHAASILINITATSDKLATFALLLIVLPPIGIV